MSDIFRESIEAVKEHAIDGGTGLDIATRAVCDAILTEYERRLEAEPPPEIEALISPGDLGMEVMLRPRDGEQAKILMRRKGLTRYMLIPVEESDASHAEPE